MSTNNAMCNTIYYTLATCQILFSGVLNAFAALPSGLKWSAIGSAVRCGFDRFDGAEACPSRTQKAVTFPWMPAPGCCVSLRATPFLESVLIPVHLWLKASPICDFIIRGLTWQPVVGPRLGVVEKLKRALCSARQVE